MINVFSVADMNMALQMLRRAIREGTIRMPTGPQRYKFTFFNFRQPQSLVCLELL